MWASVGTTMLVAPPGSRSTVLGIFLLTVSTMLLGMSTASVQVRPLLFAVSLLGATRFALSGVYEITGGAAVEKASGWVGVPIVLITVYAGTAFLLEDTMGRTVLPVARRKAARSALEGDLGRQIDDITREARVRRQL